MKLYTIFTYDTIYMMHIYFLIKKSQIVLTNICLEKSQVLKRYFTSTASFTTVNFSKKTELIHSNKTTEQTNMASLFTLQIPFAKK